MNSANVEKAEDLLVRHGGSGFRMENDRQGQGSVPDLFGNREPRLLERSQLAIRYFHSQIALQQMVFLCRTFLLGSIMKIINIEILTISEGLIRLRGLRMVRCD